MAARIRAVNFEGVRIIECRIVDICGDVPQYNLVAFADLLPVEFRVACCGATHMDDRRLPANDFLDKIGNQ